MISTNPIWFSPGRSFEEYLKFAKDVGNDAINNDGKYKRVRETRSVAILCFAMFVLNKNPWWLQLCKDDPPDALIMRQSPTVKGDHDILGVEVTSYVRSKMGMPDRSLLDQLKETKMFKEYHKYTDHDVILVHLGTGLRPDFNEVQKYMAEIKAPYEAWFIQEIQSTPDTIVKMIICNYELARQTEVNIGEAWNNMIKAKVFSTVKTVRVGSIDKVGSIQSEYIEGSPWSLI